MFTVSDLQVANRLGSHLTEAVLGAPVKSHKGLASEVHGRDFAHSHVLVYHDSLTNSYFSNWNRGLALVEMTLTAQVCCQREAPGLLPFPRHEPLSLQNGGQGLEAVTWLSQN